MTMKISIDHFQGARVHVWHGRLGDLAQFVVAGRAGVSIKAPTEAQHSDQLLVENALHSYRPENSMDFTLNSLNQLYHII